MGYFTTLPHSAPTDTVISAQTSCTPILDSFIVLFNIIASYSLHPENFWKHFFQTIEASAKKSKALLWVNRNWFTHQCCWSAMCSQLLLPFGEKKRRIFTLSNEVWEPHCMGWHGLPADVAPPLCLSQAKQDLGIQAICAHTGLNLSAKEDIFAFLSFLSQQIRWKVWPTFADLIEEDDVWKDVTSYGNLRVVLFVYFSPILIKHTFKPVWRKISKENLEGSAGAPVAFHTKLEGLSMDKPQKAAARWDLQGQFRHSYILKFGELDFSSFCRKCLQVLVLERIRSSWIRELRKSAALHEMKEV